MRNGSSLVRNLLVVILAGVLFSPVEAATVSNRYSKSKSQSITESSKTKKKLSQSRHSRPVAKSSAKKKSRYAKKRRYYERFTGNSFAENQGANDVIAGEDPVVRQAAIIARPDGAINWSQLTNCCAKGELRSDLAQYTARYGTVSASS